MWSPSIVNRDTENLPRTMAYLHAPKTPRPNLNAIDAVNAVNTPFNSGEIYGNPLNRGISLCSSAFTRVIYLSTLPHPSQ